LQHDDGGALKSSPSASMPRRLSWRNKYGKLRAAGRFPPPVEPMKANMNLGDPKLTALLRASRVSPPLPPRFQENVWRRIESPKVSTESGSWLDALATLVLRPRFAYATVAVLVMAGALLGTYQGAQTAKQDAQARYVAMVAPNPLR
jgi:hypothetical protein